jgi:hypothetical protein
MCRRHCWPTALVLLLLPATPLVAQRASLGFLVGRLGTPELLIDWRYYQALYQARGSSFMPLSIGLAF